MPPPFTPLADAAQMREADRLQIETCDYPSLLLMEEAGRQAFRKLRELYPEQRAFWVLAGPGNNGGDGLALARHLCLAGCEVAVWLAASPERYQGDARIQHQILRHLPLRLRLPGELLPEEELAAFRSEPVLIDALLGTGSSGPPRGEVARLMARFAPLGLRCAALDFPSGLDAGSGAWPQGQAPIPAQHSLSFQLPKVCHHVSPAAEACGQVHVLDIGLWPQVLGQLKIERFLINEAFLRSAWRPRPRDTHKGSYGHVLLAGGSAPMAGAMALAALGALSAGAGLCTAYAPEPCRLPLLSHCPEAMCISSAEPVLGAQDAGRLAELQAGKSVLVLGPGMGTGEAQGAFLKALLPQLRLPLLLDADALTLLARLPECWEMLPPGTLLTPHPGEMRRLSGRDDVQARRLESAEALARQRQVIVVLKGAGSIVALPDGRSFVNSSGNPGMATAGAGDVLSGMMAACLAQGYPPETAAPLAVYLHGKAGDRAAALHGEAGLLARHIAQAAGRAWQAE
jgi:NAD(P)H-hydrate epimerase